MPLAVTLPAARIAPVSYLMLDPAPDSIVSPQVTAVLSPDQGGFGPSNRGEYRAGEHEAGGVLVASTEAFAFGHDPIEK